MAMMGVARHASEDVATMGAARRVSEEVVMGGARCVGKGTARLSKFLSLLRLTVLTSWLLMNLLFAYVL